MEDPVQEIPTIIHLLTQSPPSQQRATISKYFTPNASFTHPFCRTGRWQKSRALIQAIYRWYKIMSPHIDITVNSVAFDEANLILYVHISQVFGIWVVPWYRARVALVSVLRLERGARDGRFYIRAQDDLYQVDQFVRFVAPGGWVLVWAWQFWATVWCVVGAGLLWPVSVVEEWWGRRGVGAVQDGDRDGDGGGGGGGDGDGDGNDNGNSDKDGIELRVFERKGLGCNPKVPPQRSTGAEWDGDDG